MTNNQSLPADAAHCYHAAAAVAAAAAAKVAKIAPQVLHFQIPNQNQFLFLTGFAVFRKN
jgi:hypothetical protein